jgi:hypothetical protein
LYYPARHDHGFGPGAWHDFSEPALVGTQCDVPDAALNGRVDLQREGGVESGRHRLGTALGQHAHRFGQSCHGHRLDIGFRQPPRGQYAAMKLIERRIGAKRHDDAAAA